MMVLALMVLALDDDLAIARSSISPHQAFMKSFCHVSGLLTHEPVYTTGTSNNMSRTAAFSEQNVRMEVSPAPSAPSRHAGVQGAPATGVSSSGHKAAFGVAPVAVVATEALEEKGSSVLADFINCGFVGVSRPDVKGLTPGNAGRFKPGSFGAETGMLMDADAGCRKTPAGARCCMAPGCFPGGWPLGGEAPPTMTTEP
mmetsp:Transcript_121874/g.351881  ORF Transcript_121874/g.351881 Transcript_121874/m.351881 type:complete len:200 (+) Transcript_121874:288-887(+)